jgi:hypothetical protein
MADSKTELEAQVQSLKSQLAGAKRSKQDKETKAIGVAVGHLGGVTGAVIKKYVPLIIPGEAADHPVVGALDIAFGIGAVMTDADWPSYLAAGVGGYLTGSAIEKVLP